MALNIRSLIKIDFAHHRSEHESSVCTWLPVKHVSCLDISIASTGITHTQNMLGSNQAYDGYIQILWVAIF